MIKLPMTAAGHAALEDELHQRIGVERPRLLYWFRTPPGVKVGRDALDAATRRTLEERNPDVAFDWPTLVVTPPAPEQPNWRERRIASRAARRAQPAQGVENPSPSQPRDDRRGGGRSRRRGRNRGQSPAPAAVEAANPPPDVPDSTDTPSETS